MFWLCCRGIHDEVSHENPDRPGELPGPEVDGAAVPGAVPGSGDRLLCVRHPQSKANQATNTPSVSREIPTDVEI